MHDQHKSRSTQRNNPTLEENDICLLQTSLRLDQMRKLIQAVYHILQNTMFLRACTLLWSLADRLKPIDPGVAQGAVESVPSVWTL